MDVFISIIFFFMFLLIIGVVSYFIYDYISYKNDVDKSIEITTDFINNSFDKVATNIDLTEANCASNINIISDNIHKLGLADDIIKNNINFIDNKINTFFKFDRNYNATSCNLNNKIYDYIVSSVSPNLEILSKVSTTNGFTINTPQNVIDINNFKLCNKNTSNCIDLNVNNDGFNITPTNVNRFVINSVDKKPLALFDLKQKEIYLGGVDTTAPLFIKDNELYINNINFIIKDPKNKNVSKDIKKLKKLSVSGEDLHGLITKLSNYTGTMINNVNDTRNFLDKNSKTFISAFNELNSKWNDAIDNTNQVLVYYEIMNNINQTNRSVMNTFYFKAISGKILNIDDVIKFNLPFAETSPLVFNTVPYSIQNDNAQIFNISKSKISTVTDSSLIYMVINKYVPKNTPIYWIISGNNIIKKPQNDNKIVIILGMLESKK